MKKNVILALIITLSLNGFMPKYTAFSPQYDDLLHLIESQPLLQYYFSLSVIPVQLVTKLFTDEAAAAASSEHRKKNAAPSNTSCEFSLLALAKADGNRNIANRSTSFGTGGTGAAFLAPYGHHHRWVYEGRQFHSGAPGGSLLLLLILILLALRPRGAPGDGYSIRSSIYFEPNREKFQVGFFIEAIS